MAKISVWILGDQLLHRHPGIRHAESQGSRDKIRIVLIESAQRIRKLPYQQKKLVLVLSAMRHYAQALHEQGFRVDYVHAPTFFDGLRQHVATHRSDILVTMEAAAYGERQQQRTLEQELHIPVDLLPNSQFLIGSCNPIPDPQPDTRYVMENFYRAMRRHFDVLMDGDTPVGEQWNFDKDNRKKLPHDDQPPPDIIFAPDEITQKVMEEVNEFEEGVGTVDNFQYAVTRKQALLVFNHFLESRLPFFGAYQDALTMRSHSLYHSVLSPYLNIGLLEPLELVRGVEKAYHEGKVPINSSEGFIRQLIGWREFMYWQYWRQMPGMTEKNAWNAQRALPEFAWNGDTEMMCLQYAITRAIDTGYNHHIERLMVLSNFFMLAGVNPKAVNEWFLSVYIDAYEWVMPPNVIGMGLNADDGLTATKPYIASANYINKMGDLCRHCVFDHRKRHGQNACPFNFLYWNFLLQHEKRLRSNPRTGRNVLGLRHLNDDDRKLVQRDAKRFLENLNG
jgi:deoxyribodipyrimidine photolyase-related protein